MLEAAGVDDVEEEDKLNPIESPKPLFVAELFFAELRAEKSNPNCTHVIVNFNELFEFFSI